MRSSARQQGVGPNAGQGASTIEHAESGIVRVPYDAITRPLAQGAEDADFLEGGFLAEQRLADLLFRRRIRRAGQGLIESAGQIFEIHEAARIVGPCHGQSDPYGLTGVVEHLGELTRAGAVIGTRTMQLGSTSYQIVRGVLAHARAGLAG
jgi:hypothetical protein